VELYSDLNNDGTLTSADSGLVGKPYASGASDDEKDKETEFIFANDSLSNGAWDKEDNDTPGKPSDADDDDAEEIAIKPGITEGEVWFDHPAIAGLKFYKTRKCTEEIQLAPSNHFTISSSNPWPAKVFMRAESVNFTSTTNPQVEGDLKLMIKPAGGAAAGIEAAKMKLTIVREMRAKKYFQAVRDYIFENNTLLRIDDKKFPEGSTSPTSTIRMCLMREEGSTMSPFESYWNDAYAAYLASNPPPGTAFDPRVYTNCGLGIDAALAADTDMTVVINGNQCDFTDPSLPDPRTEIGRIQRLAELTAMAAVGDPGLTDRCHGRVIIGSTKNQSSSDLDDPDALAPGTTLRGSYLAGEDPVTGTTNPGGKYIAQFADGRFKMGAARVPWPTVPGTVPTSPLSTNAIGGLSASYSSADRNNYPNSFVGYAPLADDGKGVVFVAAGKGSNGNGKVQEFYEAAKASGVPEISGATVSAGLPIINLAMLDSGDTSTALIHKTPGGPHQTVYKGNKHSGFPYYTNTFLRFKTQKPRATGSP
jgi:hypothetical protein